MGANGIEYQSVMAGILGGSRADKIYGRMDCPSALRALRTGTSETYRKKRVFFADKATAIKAGYRPCGTCFREEYKAWKEAAN
jgi:methylphosphotriester-DNA--protein-cysteine methyltransferase